MPKISCEKRNVFKDTVDVSSYNYFFPKCWFVDFFYSLFETQKLIFIKEEREKGRRRGRFEEKWREKRVRRKGEEREKKREKRGKSREKIGVGERKERKRAK